VGALQVPEDGSVGIALRGLGEGEGEHQQW
jgi:hypothetical protein